MRLDTPFNQTAHQLVARAAFLIVALILGSGMAAPAEAQNCPSQFSGAHYDYRFSLSSGNAYFRQISDRHYCQVQPNVSRRVATTVRSRLLERQPNGSFILFITSTSGSRTPRLLLRVNNWNCGSEMDLFRVQQRRFCFVESRNSSGRWIQPRNRTGHTRTNGATTSVNRPPNRPSSLSPANDAKVATPPTLRWRNNGDPDNDRVRFYVKAWVYQSGQWRQIYAGYANGTSLTLQGIPSGTWVYWRLWAGDGKAWSQPVNARFRTW